MVENSFSGDVINTQITSGGNFIILDSGGYISGSHINSGIKISALSGATIDSVTVDSGGTVYAEEGAVFSGTTTIMDGGSVSLWPDAGGTLYLEGSTNRGLTISGLENGGTLTTVIDGFDGSAPGDSDRIEVVGVTKSDVTKVSYPTNDQAILTLRNGAEITFNIKNVATTGYYLGTSAADGYLLLEVCFLAGTMISTPDGDKAVENITTGDMVRVFDWHNNRADIRKVTWAGQKNMAVRPYLPDDMAGYPVRILKDAIAPGQPYKDLLVTGEHCLFFDGKFIPARMLVNGRSVFYDYSLSHYTYYHIETEDHSVIWADGMLTESYLDTGNRSAFTQHGSVVTLSRGSIKNWNDHGAAPLVTRRDQTEPVFRAIESRSVTADIGITIPDKPLLTEDPDLHLVTENGTIIRKIRENNGYHLFLIPSDAMQLRIVSRASRPSDTIGPFVDDRRNLGVLVGDIQFCQLNERQSIDEHINNSSLDGWDVCEATPCRWTNGNALLPLRHHKSAYGGMLALQILAAGPYIMEEKNADLLQTFCA